MNRIRSLTLRQFAFISLTCFAVLLTVAASSLVVISSRMGHNSLATDAAIESIRASEELQIQLLKHNRFSLRQLLEKSESRSSEVARSEEQVLYWLAEVKKHVEPRNTEETELFASTSDAVEKYLSSGGVETLESNLEAAFDQAEQLMKLNLKQAEFHQKQLRYDDILANWIAVIIVTLGLILIPTAWYLIKINIYHPIKSLYDSIRAFAWSEPKPVKELGLIETREIARAFNELTERMSEQRKSRVMFLAAVAHDLRNPLGAIRMSADILADEKLDAKEALPIVQIISRQAEQLDRMVGDLLDSTRIEAGQLELQVKPENLVSLVSDAVKLYSSVSNIHRIQFKTDAAEIRCECDKTRIGQTLNNLLSNAIKYSPNGGIIDVILKEDDHFAVIQVSDQGIGIAEADLERIFEPFRRTKLTKSSIPGVGLGLSVVKRIIKAHKGEISVESELDKGTIVTIKIPLLEDQIKESGRGKLEPSENPVFH